MDLWGEPYFWLLLAGVVCLLLLVGGDRLVAEDGGGDCPNSVMATAANSRASSCRLLASSGVDDEKCWLRAASPGLPSEEEANEGMDVISPPDGEALVTGDTPKVNG